MYKTIRDFLETCNVDEVLRKYGITTRKIPCLYHEEDTASLTVYSAEEGTSNIADFHCFGCTHSDDFFSLLLKITGLSASELRADLEIERAGDTDYRCRYNPFNKVCETLKFNEDDKSGESYQYLLKRGLTEEEIEKHKIGTLVPYTQSLLGDKMFSNAPLPSIFIPVLNERGECIYGFCRGVRTKAYIYPRSFSVTPFVLFPESGDYQEDIVLCEGWIDAIKLRRTFKHSRIFALGGNKPRLAIELVEALMKVWYRTITFSGVIILGFDNDAVGAKTVGTVSNAIWSSTYYNQYELRVLDYCGAKDAGDAEEIRSLDFVAYHIKKYKIVSKSMLLRSLGRLRARLYSNESRVVFDKLVKEGSYDMRLYTGDNNLTEKDSVRMQGILSRLRDRDSLKDFVFYIPVIDARSSFKEREGVLFTLYGGSGQGKTTLVAYSIAKRIHETHEYILILSLDISIEMFVKIIMNQFESLYHREMTLDEVTRILVPTEEIVTLNDIKNTAQMYKNTYPTLSLIVIDYLDCISLPSLRGSTYDKETVICNELRGLTRELCLVITLIVQSAKAHSKFSNAHVDGYKGSIGIKSSSDLMVGITKAFFARDYMLIFIIKNRYDEVLDCPTSTADMAEYQGMLFTEGILREQYFIQGMETRTPDPSVKLAFGL